MPAMVPGAEFISNLHKGGGGMTLKHPFKDNVKCPRCPQCGARCQQNLPHKCSHEHYDSEGFVIHLWDSTESRRFAVSHKQVGFWLGVKDYENLDRIAQSRKAEGKATPSSVGRDIILSYLRGGGAV